MTLCLAALCAGCGPQTDDPPPGQSGRAPLEVRIDFDQRVVFSTSVLTFRMRGTDRKVPGAAEVIFRGTAGGIELEYSTIVQRPPNGFVRARGDHGDVLVELPVENGLWAEVSPNGDTVFDGSVEVNLVDEIGTLAVGDPLLGLTLTFRTDATPTVMGVSGGERWSNETIDVQGDNFLRPDEGTTWATVNGTLTFANEELGEKSITGARVPILWAESRTRGGFHIDPGVFGVRPGTFEGTLDFLNELRTGQQFPGGTQPGFSMNINEPYLAELRPESGSRGQRIEFVGRGFVPQAEDGSYVMFFQFDGIMTYDDGGELDVSGPMALERPPDRVISDERAEMAVWYEISDGRLYGLGANPGIFEGTITPLFQDEHPDLHAGVEFQGTFRVEPTKQVVHIKYLPGFSKGLEKYGLSNVELQIRQRILEVTNRDYAEVNVEFVETPPKDFLEYATIEIGGPDPTGGGKFGYDNTCNVTAERCKDTNNLYLGDYLGGINVNSADEFNTPFGGVFIEEFDYFSAELNPDSDDSSTEFDRILSPFMPALGGDPIKGTEYPNGPRVAQIDEAIHMVGSVIGNTCTHEIGHSIGLAFFPQDLIRPGESFHNKIPCDNCIMDSGSERPFVERGEVGDVGKPIFNDRNFGYLQDILPLPQ